MSRRIRTVVGYGRQTESPPDSGNYKDLITEKTYRGEVLRSSRNLANDDKVNNKISLSNRLSFVADPYMNQNYIDIRYIKFNGILWKVAAVEEEYPRLIFRMGEVYNGPTPDGVAPPPVGDSPEG